MISFFYLPYVFIRLAVAWIWKSIAHLVWLNGGKSVAIEFHYQKAIREFYHWKQEFDSWE